MERIDTFIISQISRPLTDGSRKRSIDGPYNAYVNKIPYKVNVKPELNDKDSWQAVLDDKHGRIIFMIYCDP